MSIDQEHKLTLELERIAFGDGVNHYHCQEMWGADRLLFEAFRSSGSKTKEDSNNEDNETSLALVLLLCTTSKMTAFFCK